VYLTLANGVRNQEKFALNAFDEGSQACHRDSHGHDRCKYSSGRIDNDAIIVSPRKQR
jgi:hypothetical protein